MNFQDVIRALPDSALSQMREVLRNASSAVQAEISEASGADLDAARARARVISSALRAIAMEGLARED